MIWFSALFVGLFLGILGGGGSILVVPSLTYLSNLDPKSAIASSLIIVGFSALSGVVRSRKKINYKAAFLFGFPAMLGTFMGAKLSVFFSAQFQLLLFAAIMILTAIHMFINKQKERLKIPKFVLAFEGVLVGILTGLIGVGGGFLIVPVLYSAAGLSMSVAIPTSLLIISAKSLFGALGYISIVTYNWNLIGTYSLISFFGLIIGLNIADKLDDKKLKRLFALFLIIISIFIIINNL